MDELSLTERKQLRAREHIVDAAYALFEERGFAVVTVADIAERAEVGRSTFFRHFGDKQEVLFADERRLLDHLTYNASSLSGPSAQTLQDVLARLEPVVIDLCSMVAEHPGRYERHERIVHSSAELQDRRRRKHAMLVAAFEQILSSSGTLPPVAVLAAQVAGACFTTGQRIAGFDATALVPEVRGAFALLRAGVSGA